MYPEIKEKLYGRLNTPQLFNDGYDIIIHIDMKNIVIIDGRQQHIKDDFEPPVPRPIDPILYTNKKGNKVLMQGYWEALLLDMPAITPISTMYDTGILPIAFSPKSGKENQLYALMGSYNITHKALLDFDNRRTIFQFPISFQNHAIGSSNGQYLLFEYNEEMYSITNYMRNH